MAVITISRQMGSLGDEIARIVADRLGYRHMGREVIHQAAQRADAPDAALAAIDELGLLGFSPSPRERQAYLRAVTAVVKEIAREGRAVIVGRAGQVILRGQPECLHVRIIAPLHIRIQRVAEERKISIEASTAQVGTSDEYRRTFLRRYHHAVLNDPELYDLTINTAQVDPDTATQLICQAVMARETKASPVQEY